MEILVAITCFVLFALTALVAVLEEHRKRPAYRSRVPLARPASRSRVPRDRASAVRSLRPPAPTRAGGPPAGVGAPACVSCGAPWGAGDMGGRIWARNEAGSCLPCGASLRGEHAFSGRCVVETAAGAVLSEVCLRCGEGYGRLTTEPETIKEWAKADLPARPATYCDGTPYPALAVVK